MTATALDSLPFMGRGRGKREGAALFSVDVEVCQETQRTCNGLHNLAYGEGTYNSA